MPRVPRSWRCPIHGAPTTYGCVHCDPIAKSLIETVGTWFGTRESGVSKRRLSAALIRLAAELVLRYAADDSAGAIGGNERRRSTRALALAARLYVSVVPGPSTRKTIAA